MVSFRLPYFLAKEDLGRCAACRLIPHTRVLSLAEENYADQVNSETTVFDSIRGMMRALDPHSNFFDPKVYAKFREEQSGNLYGVGINLRYPRLNMARPQLTVVQQPWSLQQ
jgi:C-terminal processing protease CtpA/Prc